MHPRSRWFGGPLSITGAGAGSLCGSPAHMCEKAGVCLSQNRVAFTHRHAMSTTDLPAPPERSALIVGTLLAVAAPVLLAFSRTPTVTMFNHLLSFLGWGGLLLTFRGAVQASGVQWRQCAPMLLALVLMVGAALWSWWGGAWPSSLALSGLALLGGAAAVLWAAGWARRARDGGLEAFHAFASAVVLAGVLSAVIAVLQVFLPSWIDGNVMAHSGLVGRGVGNLRQPNHLSSWLMWALIALLPLAEQRRFLVWRLPTAAFAAMGALLVLGVVLTASRTGVLGIVLLVLWAVVDRRLSRPVRWALWAAPLLYIVFWFLLSLWAQTTQHCNPLAKDFFAVCDQAPGEQPPPFQCQPPQRPMTWRDLLPPAAR
ncbi:MAG: hypothetical protein C4K60_14040 [Ideonella sp. MAG2]|nr:MAG: hypothetical protein C4K60_14040 [Ideonella sp. MAG2]